MKIKPISLAVAGFFFASSAFAFNTESIWSNDYTYDNPQEDFIVDGGIGHSNIDINVNNIEIKSSSNGVNVYGAVTLTAAGNITIDAKSNGLFLANDSTSENQKLTINAKGDVLISGNAWGIHGERGELEINAKSLTVNTANGITANGNSKIKVESAGDIKINSDQHHGVIALGSGGIELNAAGDIEITQAAEPSSSNTAVRSGEGDITISAGGSTKIDGYIRAGGSGNVDVTFQGADSLFTGAVLTEGTGATTIVMNDGARWIAEDDSVVTNLTLNGSVINATETGQSIAINNLTLTEKGGIFKAPTSQNADGSLSSAKLTADAVTSEDGVMNVRYTGITSDQITTENAEDLAAFSAKGVEINESAEEGDINGVWHRQTLADGTTTVTHEANTKLTNYSSVNAMSLVQWRNEINHLTKRLGDIRNARGDIGAWVRVYGGESQWGGSNEVEMDHTTIQVGGDYRINNHWIAGGAFSYTDSDADFSNGSANGDSYSLAAYATYMADGGSFLDLIARYGYLKNDITAGNMDLDTSSNAFSLSAEMGHTFRFIEDRAYIEPQFEFTYGFIRGDDTTASNEVKIDQDDFQSFITRIGIRVGYDFPEKKGSFYGMFSYNYDWLGDADGVASKNGISENLSEDLGGGWVTYGIGAQIMMGKSAYFYGELERTSGGDIDNPYLFSAGVRWTF